MLGKCNFYRHRKKGGVVFVWIMKTLVVSEMLLGVLFSFLARILDIMYLVQREPESVSLS